MGTKRPKSIGLTIEDIKAYRLMARSYLADRPLFTGDCPGQEHALAYAVLSLVSELLRVNAGLDDKRP